MNRDPRQALEGFLQDKGDATRAAYEGVLAEMDAKEWRLSKRFEYAEALVFFGLLERHVEVIYTPSGRHVRGSRTKHRLVANRHSYGR